MKENVLLYKKSTGKGSTNKRDSISLSTTLGLQYFVINDF